MTENEERLEELKDAVCRLVCIAEDAICREGFEELDNAGAEIIGYLEEIQQYRAIGTVEECRTAVERMKPRTPKESKMWNLMLCPNCGNNVMVKEKTVFRLKYCCNCGQAIDWSE